MGIEDRIRDETSRGYSSFLSAAPLRSIALCVGDSGRAPGRCGFHRVLWTGDGMLPTGSAVTPHVFEIGFSEVIDAASVAGSSATLTPEGGSAGSLILSLAADGRAAELSGATISAGVNYALHIEGLKDRSGNALQPEDRMLNVADPESFEVIADTAAPVLLAVMDGSDGIYLLFDEAVQSADMASAIQLKRQGDLVEGETQRVNPRVLKWNSTSTDLGGGFFLGAQYSLSVVGVEDLAGNAADASAMSFTHLAGDEGQLLIARQAPTDSYPMAASAYGVTTLFQGRTWHSDLGMYYYRARWYLPDGGVFGERDPVGYGDSADLYQVLGYGPVNAVDPLGERLQINIYYDFKAKNDLVASVEEKLAEVFQRAGITDVEVSTSEHVVKKYLWGHVMWLPQAGGKRMGSLGDPHWLFDIERWKTDQFFTSAVAKNDALAKKRNYDYDVSVTVLENVTYGSSTSLGWTREDAWNQSTVHLRQFPKGATLDEEANYIANVAGHEIGHQFGMYPKDGTYGMPYGRPNSIMHTQMKGLVRMNMGQMYFFEESESYYLRRISNRPDNWDPPSDVGAKLRTFLSRPYRSVK